LTCLVRLWLAHPNKLVAKVHLLSARLLIACWEI
jgi:hypothetical protein